MLPAAFVTLDTLPLTPNGKVDRQALPAPEYSGVEADAYLAPRSVPEKRIAAIFSEVLKVDQVGVRSNFFDLGGHSLLLVKVHKKLREVFDEELSIVELFEYPTVEALARRLGRGVREPRSFGNVHARIDRRKHRSGAYQPIAVVGMAGRFPGARDPEALWRNICAGKESVTAFSDDELRAAGVSEELLNRPNYVKSGVVLEDVEMFDAPFFGYTPRDAQLLDPQQRFFLECTWEALESAGYDPARCAGAIGVFAGVGTNHYPRLVAEDRALSGFLSGVENLIASEKDHVATRVSYKFGLRGPSLAVQTACSTSLVAVHVAARSLQEYECDMALAGGVWIQVPQSKGYLYEPGGINSPDGHCRAFDANAGGTIGGSGASVVVLKRLEDALADGDTIHAVIKGSAINNDGAGKVGYTAPSVEGQAEVIAAAHAEASVDAASIGYVEAHGTGTRLGDPVEVAALTQVFRASTRKTGYCGLGSIKTNVGHLNTAAGCAGLIKAALAVRDGVLPPSLHYEKPNPEIDFASTPFYVNTALMPWKDELRPRRAGVSSFGIGGTNAHVVLEEAPAVEPSGPARGWQLLCISAKSESALERARANLARYLAEHPETSLADAAYTLQVGRGEFSQRCVVVCRDVADAAALEAGAGERVIAGVHKGGSRSVVFMFSGQGAQYPNMGLGLYRTEAVFREAVDQCCQRLKRPLGLDLRGLLFPAEGELEQAAERLKRTELTQPALFVVEYALARLWMALGVQPAAMIGHSVGEYVAACLAGVMSLEDALDLVAERGRLMGQLPAGAMLAVALEEAELLPLLGGGLSIAAVNAPGLCVVSGPEREIAALEAHLIKRGLTPRRLHTSHAFHSSMMEPILEAFTQRVSAITLNPPRLPYISNVSGEWITAAQAMDPGYYATHLRRAVRFSQGLERLFADPSHVFLEVGPGQTLAGLARRHPGKKEEHAFVASLRHPEDSRADEAFFMESVGRLWLAGARPDWAGLHAGQRRRRVRLPTYPFERKRYWAEPSRPSKSSERIRRCADPSEWIYLPSWRRAPAPSPDPRKRAARWLLFADLHGLGARLAAELTARGAQVASVTIGERFARSGPGTYTLNPAVREHYDQLVEALKRDSLVPEFIAHLWAISRDDELREDEAFLAECRDRGLFSVVFVAQALEAGGLNGPLGLAVLTSHANEVSGAERVCPEKAMALGPCKVIGMEQPHILARSIDVSVSGDLSWLARALASDLCATWSEQVVSYRGRYRWVQGYEQVPLKPLAGAPAMLREGGVYLISGGLGRIGLEIAEYLARTVRARIALVGRNPLPERDQWAQWLATRGESDPTSRRILRVQAIEAVGGEVLLCHADVADERQMGAAIAAAEARFGRLHGVMHAAGPGGRPVPIRSLRRGDCDAQFRPRLQGLRVLERLLRGRTLDFCLVHSSLASILGVLGVVSYTAAHLFMDAFAYQANGRNGTPWLTVNWDIWGIRNEGTAAQSEFYMNPGEAIDVLGRLLSVTDAAQFLVSTGPLQGRIDQWLRREERKAEGQAAEQPSASRAHPRPALSTEYAAPRTGAERTLAGIWAEMLGIDRVGIHDNFFELGGDSVLNIQVTARANQAGLRIAPTQVFEHQTVAALTAALDAGRAIASEHQAAEADDDASADLDTAEVSESDLAEIGRQVGTRIGSPK